MAPKDGRATPDYMGVALCAFVVVVTAWYSLSQVWHFTIDDSGISYAYAKHIAEGYGAVAVVGGPTIEGYSNPLWVVLLAACHLVGLNILTTAKWLGAALFLLGCAGLTTAMTRVAAGSRRQLRCVDVVPALLVAGCAKFVVWMPGGLENALYFALMAWAIAAELGELETPHRFPRASFCLLGLCLTRPEGALYAALHGIFRCFLVLRTLRRRRGADHATSRSPLNWRVSFRPILQLAAIVGGGYACFLILRWFVFGQWVPNTYFAKVSVNAASLQEGWEYLLHHLKLSEVHWLLPFGLFGLFYRAAAGALLGAYLFGAVFFIVYSGGDWMPHGRFVAYGVPLVCLAAGFGLLHAAKLLERIRLRKRPLARWVAAPTVIGVLALLSLWANANHPRLTKIARANKCHFCSRLSDFERLKRVQKKLHLSSATLLTQDFGGPAWASSESLYPIDFLGLCDHTLSRVTPYRAKRQFFDSERVRFRYALHEQGYFPTFLYVPRNFWKPLKSSLEFRQGYYSLPISLLGRTANRAAPFAVSRAAFIDFFPPITTLQAKPFGSWMYWGTAGTLGSEHGGDPNRPNEFIVYLALSQKGGALASSRVTLKVATEAGQELAAVTQPFFPRSGLARQWRPGEVRALRFELPPSEALPAARLHLHVRHKKQTSSLDLGPLADVQKTRAERKFTPFPAAMPAVGSAELGDLMARLATVLERRFGRAGQAHGDSALAQELRDFGDARAPHDRDEAYLAYVGAAQADRRLLGELSEVIWRLRPTGLDHDLATELALLRSFYQRGDTPSFDRLLDHYLTTGRLAKARYFRAAKPDGIASEVSKGVLQTRPSELTQPLPGVESDFDGTQSQGWKFSGNTFGVTPLMVHTQRRPVLAGYQGAGVLSSWSATKRHGQGAATSDPFTLEGSLLSFLLAGSKSSKAELLVDGRPVLSRKGVGPASFRAVFWPVDSWVGRQARIRVTDSSRKKRHHVAIDHIRLWK